MFGNFEYDENVRSYQGMSLITWYVRLIVFY
jgi:hypothetical protein